jgi:hypothetical protein
MVYDVLDDNGKKGCQTGGGIIHTQDSSGLIVALDIEASYLFRLRLYDSKSSTTEELKPLASWANSVAFIFRSILLIKYDMGSLSVTGILLATFLALVVLFGTFLKSKWLYSIS